MNPWIKFADAPGYTVVTLTTVFDSFGYCRIGNTDAARRPSSRISRLTTTDRTGRLMKISVKAIAGYPAKYKRLGMVPPRDRRLNIANAALRPRHVLVARRLRRNYRSRIGRDRHGHARLQLELSH